MKTFQDLLKRTESGHFKAIDAGKYSLSIQGDYGNYCNPREKLEPHIYSSMELAIFKDGKWLCVTRSRFVMKFDRIDELMDRADGWFSNGSNSGSVVFGYVPIDLLNDFYLYLKDNS